MVRDVHIIGFLVESSLQSPMLGNLHRLGGYLGIQSIARVCDPGRGEDGAFVGGWVLLTLNIERVFICTVSLLCTALYAYMRSVLIM